MKVLVLVTESGTDPKAFKDLAAFEKYLADEGFYENFPPEEYTLMAERLEKGESWADHESWVGWVEVEG